MRFEVVVKQTRMEGYYDSEQGKRIEWESNDELKGAFYDWEQTMTFVNNVIDGFPGSTVEVKVVRNMGIKEG